MANGEVSHLELVLGLGGLADRAAAVRDRQRPADVDGGGPAADGAGGGAADDADPTVGEHHGGAIPVEPRPAHVGEGFALDGLHRGGGHGRAAPVATEHGARLPGAADDLAEGGPVEERPPRGVGQHDGGGGEPVAAGVAGAPQPHPAVALRPGEVGGVEGQGGAERAAAHVAPAVGADQDVGDRFRRPRRVAVGAGGELERGGHDVGDRGRHLGPLEVTGGVAHRRLRRVADHPGLAVAVAVAARHERLEPQTGSLRRRAAPARAPGSPRCPSATAAATRRGGSRGWWRRCRPGRRPRREPIRHSGDRGERRDRGGRSGRARVGQPPRVEGSAMSSSASRSSGSTKPASMAASAAASNSSR